MPNHFHVIVCVYFCSVEDSVLPTENYPTECVVSEQYQKSRVLVRGDADLRPIQSVLEASFPEEIHKVVLPVHNYKCVFSVSLWDQIGIMDGLVMKLRCAVFSVLDIFSV
jgi:hypothetical protein